MKKLINLFVIFYSLNAVSQTEGIRNLKTEETVTTFPIITSVIPYYDRTPSKIIDTIFAILMYSDTALKEYHGEQHGIQYDYKDFDYSLKWMIGYKVVKYIPAGWGNNDRQYPSYLEFKEFLDENKKQLKPSIVIWISK